MVGFMGMNMANSAGTTMMGAVNQTTEELKEERIMPEPGTLFAKREEAQKSKVDTPAESRPVETAQTSYPKFCPNCGTPTSGGNFCGNCGNKLK